MSAPGRIPALVTGHGPLVLGAIRALGRAGIPTYVGSARSGSEAASRWFRPVPGSWSDDASLAENLVQCGIDQAVLIPTSEYDAIDAAELTGPLRSRFPTSSASADTLRLFADKALARDLFEDHGVPTPRTWEAGRLEGPDRLDDETLEHVFLKPLDSGRFSGAFVRKSLRPYGRQAMLDAVAEYGSQGHTLMVQEYIPGPPSNSYLLDGFIDRHGELKGLFVRRRMRQYPIDFGNSSAVRSVDRSVTSEAERVLVPMLESVGYRGIFNAEFKQDPRDGVFKLLEVNGRTWLYAEFASQCGFNALEMAWRDAQDLEVEALGEYTVGSTVIHPYYDIFAGLELRARGEARTRDVVRSWIGAHQLLFAWDDPRPSMIASGQTSWGWLARRLNKPVGFPLRRIFTA
ncbi:MAG: hypothetical protein AAF389_16950 [Gemmatimonadota bacterium]